MNDRTARSPQAYGRRRDTGATEDRQGRIITFYSYKGGTGRTMALANTAWILAANGHRVLTVDWDLEAPGLGQFFRPFLDPDVVAATTGIMDLFADYLDEARRPIEREPDWYEDFTRIHRHAISLAWNQFPAGGKIDFVPAGQQNRDYSGNSRVDWDLLYERYDGQNFIQSLRSDMKRRYDYVLIDSRTGLTDTADICTVEMPDDLVVCFTLSDQSIDGASRIARVIEDRYGDRNIRILPVPMRIDEGEKEKADAGRALARIKFSGLPAGLSEPELARYWTGVEIPYRPFYAYEEILAPFGDQPGLPGSMLAACERLTREVTQGRVVGLPVMPEDVRLRHLDGFVRRRPTAPADLYLSYVPEDRAWADWIAALLTDAGFRVVPRDASAGANPRSATERGIDSAYRTIALLSAGYLQSPQAQALWDRTIIADPAGARRQVIPVRVSDVRLTAPYNSRNPVDLIGRDEQAAALTLLRALGRTEPELPERSPGAPRFPGTRPTFWQVPQRNHSFTGRIKVLDDLRAQLSGGTTAVLPPPQTLYGLGGVGKTQVALEYAHRYMSHYDLVWWIDAEQSENVVVDLAELAGRLGLRVGDNVNEAAQAARDALRQGIPTPNWLLIFDNADEPTDIRRYFPDGPGHILVTSRNQGWSGQAGVLNVDVFDRTESIDHLTRRVRNLTRQDADRVAEAVGDLPLAVEVAAAWLETTRTPVDAYVNQLKAEATRVLAAGETPADYPTPVGLTWNVSIARLREQSPAAVRLLELCAFFAPEPISLRQFFFSEQMRLALYPYDPELTDTFLLGKVLRAVSRYALAKTDAASDSFQVHRLVQAVVRSGMSDADRNTAMHQVHGILVSARPSRGDTDDPVNWPTLEKIWPHLTPSRAQDCDEKDVRELLIDRVRYLWKRVDLDQALQLGRQLDSNWTTRSESETDPVEHRTWLRQILSLRLQIANVLRSQGSYTEALALNQSTLAAQRDLLGEHNPYTLMTASSLAADLRYLNRFQEALAMDLDTYDQFIELFGEDDPRTLSVANNLAIDHRLVGNSDAARDLDQDTAERRAAVLGPHHPYTLASKSNLARDLREMGDYKNSVELLREVLEAFASLAQSDLPEDLRNSKSLAVSLRRGGDYAEAREITERTYQRYMDRYGPDHADSLACRLNLAADLSAAGDKETARDIAGEAYEGHRRLLGEDHPFTLACENNLGIYLRGSADLDGAIRHGEQAVSGLSRVLGAEHPFTLNATLNLANAYGDNNRLADAERIGRAALDGLLDRYGAGHPDSLVAQSNLAVTLRAAGRRNEAEAHRMRALAGLVELFGEDHPSVSACRGWQRINRDLEPQPM